MSGLYQALSGSDGKKLISPHEGASLFALAEELAACMREEAKGGEDWTAWLDGFFFSFVIDHIGKEFDLLKLSADREYALNIELKSEAIEEERIRKQLEQNRYYLAHSFHTIFSFTFVMSTGTLYSLNHRGYMRKCPVEQLVHVLRRPELQAYVERDIDRFFRSADYLISPVSAPGKFLQGQYFLTNQQFDFKRRILEHLRWEAHPVIAIAGIAGTGKTLLAFDLAMELSRRNRVLFLHAGLLRKGHFELNDRLKNVDICSFDEITAGRDISGYACVIIDEAGYIPEEMLRLFLERLEREGLPLVMTYDPHDLLSEISRDTQQEQRLTQIRDASTLLLVFSGNIRINRPVYSFLRTLLDLKDRHGHHAYDCIETLYAGSQEECRLIIRHFEKNGYSLIRGSVSLQVSERLIAEEHDKVLIVLDEDYYYDDSMHLCSRSGSTDAIRLLYEWLSRTRESLCLIVKGNRELFSQILSIRLQCFAEDASGELSLRDSLWP